MPRKAGTLRSGKSEKGHEPQTSDRDRIVRARKAGVKVEEKVLTGAAKLRAVAPRSGWRTTLLVIPASTPRQVEQSVAKTAKAQPALTTPALKLPELTS
jgi:hypothetical protein